MQRLLTQSSGVAELIDTVVTHACGASAANPTPAARTTITLPPPESFATSLFQVVHLLNPLLFVTAHKAMDPVLDSH